MPLCECGMAEVDYDDVCEFCGHCMSPKPNFSSQSVAMAAGYGVDAEFEIDNTEVLVFEKGHIFEYLITEAKDGTIEVDTLSGGASLDDESAWDTVNTLWEDEDKHIIVQTTPMVKNEIEEIYGLQVFIKSDLTIWIDENLESTYQWGKNSETQKKKKTEGGSKPQPTVAGPVEPPKVPSPALGKSAQIILGRGSPSYAVSHLNIGF